MIDLDHPDDGNITITSGMGICDFCSPPQPAKWVYPCNTFVLPIQMHLPQDRLAQSNSDWGACETCAALIESRSKNKLARRGGELYDLGIQLPTVLAFFMHRKKDQPRRPTEQPYVLLEEPTVIPG